MSPPVVLVWLSVATIDFAAITVTEATMEMTGHEQLSAIKSAAEACIIAGRADLIVKAIDQAWWNGNAAATTWLANYIEAERVKPAERTAPAVPPAAAAAAAGASIFGRPTAKQCDDLAAALERRFRSEYGVPYNKAAGKSGA
jgi:hypothetical protein